MLLTLTGMFLNVLARAYCQTPLVLSTAVIARPAPLPTIVPEPSVIVEPSCVLMTKPGLAAGSSASAGRAGVRFERLGAVLPAET